MKEGGHLPNSYDEHDTLSYQSIPLEPYAGFRNIIRKFANIYLMQKLAYLECDKEFLVLGHPVKKTENYWLMVIATIGIVSGSSSFASAACRKPPQFLSDTLASRTTNFLNYLICLNKNHEERISLLEHQIHLGRQELAELREQNYLLLQKSDN